MIGYYAHHVGSGHVYRAASIAGHLGPQMTMLSSAASAASINQVRLARDDDPPADGDVTAAQSLHWVPLRHNGLRKRNSQIVRWAEEQCCSALVSDVSVEVLLLARLLSIPPVAVAMRGQRLDRAHALGYDVASTIIAPWPRLTHGPWPQRWLDKTVWVGPVSRFDGRERVPGRCGRPGRCVVLMLGRGGDSMTETALREAASVPETHWHLLGHTVGTTVGDSHDPEGAVERHGWVADPWPVLCRADVVVAAPGDCAVADIAAAGRPMIAVPQQRPFGEQQAQAAALARHWLCLLAPTWPNRRAWPQLLDRAESLGGTGWSAYSDGQGCARMAATLVEIAGRGRRNKPRQAGMPSSRVGASAVSDARPNGALAQLALG